MPEVTYYFNAYDEGNMEWTTTPQYMVDNVLTNYASTTVDGQVEKLTGNTCPGTDLGAITKVEIRVFAYGDGDDRIDLWPWTGPGGVYETTPGSEAGWGVYHDITNDAAVPSPLNWANIQELLICDVEFVAIAKGNTMYCAKVEIRVTYTEPWVPPESDIDVGADPINRASDGLYNTTYVDKNNPANASDTLHTILIYPETNMTGLRVGTFYLTNGNTLKCRDSATLGAAEAGAVRTFTEDSEAAPLAITVVEGDYIGCYFFTGNIEADTAGFSGIWYIGGEGIDPDDEGEYDFAAGAAMSLYGYGDIVAAPENTVYLVKATGKRTQLSVGAVAIRIDPATGRRGTDPSFPKFLVREDDGTLWAKSA